MNIKGKGTIGQYEYGICLIFFNIRPDRLGQAFYCAGDVKS